jgi:hypothetical protein
VRDAATFVVFAVGVPLIGWTLVHGLRTGTMDAAGVPYASYARSKNPIMFWLATIFNGAFCVGGAAFLLQACLQGI